MIEDNEFEDSFTDGIITGGDMSVSSKKMGYGGDIDDLYPPVRTITDISGGPSPAKVNLQKKFDESSSVNS